MHTKLKAVVVSACILAKSESADTDPVPRTTPRIQQQPRRQWWIKPVPLKMIVVGFDWQLGYKQMQFKRHCISWKHVYRYSDKLQTKWNTHQHTQHITPLTNHHRIRLVHFYVAILNMHYIYITCLFRHFWQSIKSTSSLIQIIQRLKTGFIIRIIT